MKSNPANNQKILVFVCDEYKFAHIGVFNMYDKHGKPNYSGSLSSYKTEATRVKKLLPEKNSKGTENAFGNSFMVRLINTGNDLWYTAEEYIDVEPFELRQIAIELHEKYEGMDYSVSGSLGRKGIRQTGFSGVTNTKINNATKDRLYQIVEKLVEGISNINLRQVQIDIYKQYNYGGLDTRRKFFNFIHQNLDKYIKQ